jgi:hypothetical protein
MKPIASMFWLGVLFLGIGALLLGFQFPYLTRGIRVEGVVVDVRERMNRRGYTYHPVVCYQAGKRTVKINGRVGSGVNPYHIGQKVSVIYLPEEPEAGIIGDFVQMFLFPAIFGAVGLVGTAGALGFAYMSTLEGAPTKDRCEDLSVRPAEPLPPDR